MGDNKLSGQTMNIKENLLAELKRAMLAAFADGKLDFDDNDQLKTNTALSMDKI